MVTTGLNKRNVWLMAGQFHLFIDSHVNILVQEIVVSNKIFS